MFVTQGNPIGMDQKSGRGFLSSEALCDVVWWRSFNPQHLARRLTRNFGDYGRESRGLRR